MTITHSGSADIGPLEAKLIQSDLVAQSNDTIRITDAYSSVNISFQRTLRVPDDETENNLPASLGTFPLYSVRQYEATLPSNMAMKGGLFFPMYQREAMWINFKASKPFAIQIRVGTINAISGEPMQADYSTTLHRLTKLGKGQSIQDYIVTPDQRWLDGIATKQGYVRQFVAMPLGSGFTVEAQVIGQDVAGGMQLVVIPSIPAPELAKGPRQSGTMSIFVRTLTGKSIRIDNVVHGNTMEQIKLAIQDREGIPPDQQRLIARGQQVRDHQTIDYYGICDGDLIHLVLILCGGGSGLPPSKQAELGIAAGGLIKQCIIEDPYSEARWDIERAISFNVQILNSQLFQQVTGMPPPASPISAKTYASQGLPFFDIYNETSLVAGDFKGIKSVGAIDAEISSMGSESNGSDQPDSPDWPEQLDGVEEFEEVYVPTVQNPVILLNPDGTQLNFKPVSVLKAELKRLNHAQF